MSWLVISVIVLWDTMGRVVRTTIVTPPPAIMELLVLGQQMVMCALALAA